MWEHTDNDTNHQGQKWERGTGSREAKGNVSSGDRLGEEVYNSPRYPTENRDDDENWFRYHHLTWSDDDCVDEGLEIGEWICRVEFELDTWVFRF